VVDLADRLRDQGRRERFLGLGDSTVSAALGLSYGYLPVPLQRMFRLVGLVPAGEIAVGAVAALADVPVDDAEEALDELVEANLVSQGASGRYRLHDLVRDCARGLALRHDPPGDLRTATHRLLDYHLALAWRGCRSIARGPYRFPLRVAYPPAHLPALDSWARALPVLRAEYPTLVEMARFAAENGWPEHAWQLPCALQPFLTRMNYRDNSIELIERALAAARASGAVHGEAAMLGSTALILREQGRFEAAEELFTQAIAISRRLGDRAAVVYQLADLGFTQRRAGRLLQARETFLAGQRLAADTGDDAGYVTLTNNLAVVCIAMGAYADAVGHLSEALAVLQGVGSSQDEILVLGNLGWALTEQGRAGEALPLLARAVQVGRDTGYRHAEAMSLARKASARLQLGDGAGALADARAAVGLAREAHAPYAECEALLVAGNALLAAGAAGAAEDAYQQARDLALGYRLGHLEARGHQAVGELRLRAGDRRAARDCFAAALDLYAGECVEVGQVRRQLVGMTG
jgi:tetratricopeptide (TPR) repeat protein